MEDMLMKDREKGPVNQRAKRSEQAVTEEEAVLLVAM